MATAPAWAASSGSCPQLDPGLLEMSPSDKVILTADQIQARHGEAATLLGSVHLRQGDREFLSPSLHYDASNRLVVADSPSQFRNQNYIIRSQSASYDLNSQSGIFHQSDFTLILQGARGHAEEMAVQQAGNATLSTLSYTSCPPGHDSWLLTAKSLELDQDKGLGIARGATLHLGPVPVLYLPYLRFPLDDARHTGLLYPTIGSNTRTGFDARWPLYLNLAPNYDVIVTPREMSSRGFQIGTSGRYLFERAAGKANFEYLPEDRQFETGRSRSFVEWTHDGLLSQRLSLQIHYAEASDPNYFEDLSYITGLSTQPYLESSARVVYQAPASYSVQVMVQKFQTLAASVAVDAPYQRLPEIRFDYLSHDDFLGTRFGLDAIATNFAKSSNVQGLREVMVPSLQWARDSGAFYTALQGDMNLTRYQLRDADDVSLTARNRAVPVLSADTGLRFERLAEDGGIERLEPRLFYLYVPYRDQDGLPVFDTGEPDFDFPRLFARNRFVGYDRIADANQLTAAATYRQLDPIRGSTRLTLSLGQIYRFEPSRVTVPGLAARDAGSSDYLASGEWRISEHFSSTALVQLSPDTGGFSRTSFALRYRDPLYRADLAYRFRAGLLEQLDSSFSAPITASFRLAGRVRYSIRDDSILDSLAGIDYETCCYAVRTAYRRYLVNSSGRFDSGVFVQLELKGLSRLGTGLNDLLPKDNRALGDD